MIRRIRIRSFEVGLVFRDGDFATTLEPGTHWRFDPLSRERVRILSKRDPWLVDEYLDQIHKSGKLAGSVEIVDLHDFQRALVWVDGRFSKVLGPGLHAYWTGERDVRVETVDALETQFQHAELSNMSQAESAHRHLDICCVERQCVGVLFIDGRYVDTFDPGHYAFWKNGSTSRLVEVDMRETTLDIAGQEIMTSDKVTLRMNAVVTYRVADPLAALTVANDAHQSLYREIQLVLRATIGARKLDEVLASKEEVAEEIEQTVRPKAQALGLAVVSVGVRDLILPGDMKELMNQVIEARTAAEAKLIVRREETAAMRSQANTAKLLADNPTLMRLRELEVLEKIAVDGKLNVVLGEKGLADRVVNLI